MIYPQLPGLPTMPGWYWRVDDHGDWRVVRVYTSLDYGLAVAGRSLSDYCALRALVWYGPIPEPTTGCPHDTDGDGNCGRPACPVCRKREPCKAWRRGGDPQRQEVWVLVINGEDIAEVWPASVGTDWAWSACGWTDYGFPNKAAAMLAAEDAVRQECHALLAVVNGGNDHA